MMQFHGLTEIVERNYECLDTANLAKSFDQPSLHNKYRKQDAPEYDAEQRLN